MDRRVSLVASPSTEQLLGVAAASSRKRGAFASFAGQTFSLSPGRPNFEVFLVTLEEERKKKDRVLGYVELPLRDMKSGSLVQAEFDVQPKTTSSKHHVSGEVHLKLLYAKADGKPDQLHIQVLEASNLAPRDSSGAASPVVSISVGDQVFRTAVVKGTTDPEFNERFAVLIDETKVASFTLLVLHSQRRAKDAFMGQVVYPLSSLQVNVVQDLWLKLNPRVYDEVSFSGDRSGPGLFGRIKVRYMYTEDITLPLLEYAPLCHSLFTYDPTATQIPDGSAIHLIRSLTISSKSIATALVDVGMALFPPSESGKADGRLVNVLDMLLALDAEDATAGSIFRANTVSTLAVAHLLRQAGGAFIGKVYPQLFARILNIVPRDFDLSTSENGLELVASALDALLDTVYDSVSQIPHILLELFSRLYRLGLSQGSTSVAAAGTGVTTATSTGGSAAAAASSAAAAASSAAAAASSADGGAAATVTETSTTSASDSDDEDSSSFSYSYTSSDDTFSMSDATASASGLGATSATMSSAASPRRPHDMSALQAVSAFVILRFFAPALLTPVAYGVAKDVASHKAMNRILARVLQKMGNLLLFDPRKNPDLVGLNPVMVSHFGRMAAFLRRVSSPGAHCIDPSDQIEVEVSLSNILESRRSRKLKIRTNMAFILGRLLDARRDVPLVDPTTASALDTLSETLNRVSVVSSSAHVNSKEFQAANRKLSSIGSLTSNLKSSFAAGSETSDAVLEFRMRKRVTTGAQFTLHSKGKTKPVYVACVVEDAAGKYTLVYETRISSSEDLVALGSAAAASKPSRSSSRGTIQLADAIDVVKGQVTSNFSKTAKLEQQHLSFSLILGDDDSLDLDAQTEKERDDWVDSLRHYVKKARLAATTSPGSSSLAVPPPSPGKSGKRKSKRLSAILSSSKSSNSVKGNDKGKGKEKGKEKGKGKGEGKGEGKKKKKKKKRKKKKGKKGEKKDKKKDKSE